LTQDASQPRAAVGLGKDGRAPVDVAAPRLDVDDTAKTAVFSGGTKATQGESSLTAITLRIAYEGSAAMPGAAPAAPNTEPSAGAASRVKTMTADGQVVINNGADQRVMADAVMFDVAADTALFTGSAVEVQQGRNRLLGRRLVIDRKAGRSRLESPAEGRTPAGRIQTVFYQSENRAAAPKPKTEAEGGVMFATSFRADPNAPTDVVADTLDINDAAKQAIWRGKVRAQQGDVVIETPEMAATYSGETGLMATPEGAAAAKAPGAKGGAQLSKIDARGGVAVTSKDGQQVTGQNAVFDMKSNTVLVTGGARAIMGRNSTAGEAIKMDLTTGMVEVITGFSARVSASEPSGQPKSAVGPGGLPAIPGIQAAAPALGISSPENCPPGRTCLQFFVDDAKQAQAEKKKADDNKKQALPATPETAPAEPKARPPRPSTRTPTDGWLPQSEASPVYRN
jgi:lipopolysaccharide export system protein LptA